jgi:hypothetical protein
MNAEITVRQPFWRDAAEPVLTGPGNDGVTISEVAHSSRENWLFQI